MTPQQLKLIHVARRATGMSEEDYRTGLRSIAHVESSKNLTNIGFEDMLAWFESCGFRDTQHHAHFWRDIVDRRSSFANSRQLHEIARLYSALSTQHSALGLPVYTLASLVEHQCNDRTHEPSKLTPAEANNLIEAIKAIKNRVQGSKGSKVQDSPTSPPLNSGTLEPLNHSAPVPDESDIPF